MSDGRESYPQRLRREWREGFLEGSINRFGWFAVVVDVVGVVAAGPLSYPAAGIAFGAGGVLFGVLGLFAERQKPVAIAALVIGVLLLLICVVRVVMGGLSG